MAFEKLLNALIPIAQIFLSQYIRYKFSFPVYGNHGGGKIKRTPKSD